jgi:hypothetical protein
MQPQKNKGILLKTPENKIVGKYEWVFFPEVQASAVHAKIDTGARTSTIHAAYLHVEQKNGKEILICRLLGDKKKTFTFDKYSIKKVKSSNGMEESRFTVSLEVIFANKKMKAQFTLSSRGSMNFPVLIGRNILKRGFLVDVSKTYVYTAAQ